jgi:hypothetical protein
VSQPLIFDQTAIIALFRSHPGVYHYWTLADAGEARIVLPAAAVAEANRMLRAPWNAWEAVLFPNPDAPGAVAVAPLDEHTAVEAGQHGDVATGHVTYEARQIHGVVVTQAGGAYQESAVSLLVI